MTEIGRSDDCRWLDLGVGERPAGKSSVKISSSYFKSVLSRFEINIAGSLSGKR
jgi:hypothetical protein